MTDTTFVDKKTNIVASWLNDVNAAVYRANKYALPSGPYRTQSAKNTDYISVKDFGAVGDGVGDDTAAIQATINYISTTVAGPGPGGTVYFPAGHYKLSAAVSLPYGVSVSGAGGVATFLECYNCDGLHLVETIENDGMQFIQDLQILGKSGTNFQGIVASSGTFPTSENDGFYVERVQINNFDIGINFNLTWHSYITHCIIHNVNTAILLGGNDVLITIRDNQLIHESGGPGAALNIGINMTSTNTEANMFFNNFIYGFATGMVLTAPWSTVVSDNTFLTAAAAGVSQICLQFATAQEHLVIQNNIFESTATTGSAVVGVLGTALFTPSNSTTIIQNNRFRDDTGVGSSIGLQINNAGNTNQNRVIVQNNNFSGYSLFDFACYNPIRVTIENNNFESTAPTYSLYISGGSVGPIFVNQNWCAKNLQAEPVYLATGQIVLHNNVVGGAYTAVPPLTNTAPTTGTWAQGAIAYNNSPTSGTYVGWVCTVAGSPGTWKTFGLIS